MSGPAHCPYLVTSLWTLRKHWKGRVIVGCFSESQDVVARIGDDARLDIEVRPIHPPHRGRNDQFLAKIGFVRDLACGGFSSVAYLDADTTIHLDPVDLFLLAESRGFCATQFNDWTTHHNAIKGRIESLREFGLDGRIIDDCLCRSHPSVNGGVFSASPEGKRVLNLWEAWTKRAMNTFIPDEKVLHLIATANKIGILTGGRWNCSPKYQPRHLKNEDICIRHYHGDSNCRPAKSQRGWDLWRPIWVECLRENVGGCSKWWKICGNRWLPKLEKDFKSCEGWTSTGLGLSSPVIGS